MASGDARNLPAGTVRIRCRGRAGGVATTIRVE
jgi:hypothetical protein